MSVEFAVVGKRAGKDTTAGMLAAGSAALGARCDVLAFGDALRETAAAAYGVPVGEFTDDALKDAVDARWGITRRQMLKNVGYPAVAIGGEHEHWEKLWEMRVRERVARVAAQYAELGGRGKVGGKNYYLERPGALWDGHVTELLAQYASAWGEFGSRHTFARYCTYAITAQEHGAEQSDAEREKYGDYATFARGSDKLPGRAVFDGGFDNNGPASDWGAAASQILDELLWLPAEAL